MGARRNAAEFIRCSVIPQSDTYVEPLLTGIAAGAQASDK